MTTIFKLLYQFFQNTSLYNVQMTEAEMYKFFLKDAKKENQQEETKVFLSTFLSQMDATYWALVKSDLSCYNKNGNNNLVKHEINSFYSSRKLSSMKKEIKTILRTVVIFYNNIKMGFITVQLE